MCKVSKFVPPAIQCFHCQKFGHVAKACPLLSDSTALKCARCAGNHPVRDCHCPSRTKCSNARLCTHIKVQCANCGGPHKSISNACPIKAEAQATLAARWDNGSPYYNKSFRPPTRSGTTA